MPTMKNTNPTALRAHVSAYVLGRVAAGLAGVPAHQKKPALIGFKQIAAETRIPLADVLCLRSHIFALAETHGLEDPVRAHEDQLIERVRSFYAVRPVPWGRKGLYLEQVALDLGVSTSAKFAAPRVLAVLIELAAKNGRKSSTTHPAESVAALARYRERLIAGAQKVPWNQAADQPATWRIAKESGLPLHVFSWAPIMQALDELVRELGREEGETIAQQVDRLTAYVEAQMSAASRRRATIAVAFIAIRFPALSTSPPTESPQ